MSSAPDRLGRHRGALGDQPNDFDLRVARSEQALQHRLQEVVNDRPAALRRQAIRDVVDRPGRVGGEELPDSFEVPGAEGVEEPPHLVLWDPGASSRLLPGATGETASIVARGHNLENRARPKSGGKKQRSPKKQGSY